MKVFNVVGQRIQNVDAVEKVTGAAKFTIDLKLPGMLYGKILRSPYPHAKIINIDTSKAEKLRGVKAVITAKDTPKIKFGLVKGLEDKLPLEDEKVRFIGDEIAAVGAIDEEIAKEAMELIKVDYEILTPVFEPQEAMLTHALRIHGHMDSNVVRFADMECGHVEEGFAESDLVIEDKFITQAQSHCCMEVHCCIAQWDPSGKVTVWSSTQVPHSLRSRLATVCKIAASHIRVIKPYVGGGFGSKADMDPMEPISVFLSMKAGKPVKIENSRKEEFFATRTRHPVISRLKFGFKKNGALVAKQAKVIIDNGAYCSHGPGVLSYNCALFSALYRVPNIKYEGSLVYTNKTYGGACRGYGDPQATFGQEVIMDMASERLGLDPIELRLRNANRPNEVTANAVRITSCGLTECIEKSAESFGWGKSLERKNRVKGRGAGVASMIYTGGGSKGSGSNYSGASVKINIDGSVSLFVGASDIGQGSNTILSQITAEVLGLSIEDIRIISSDTDLTPACFGTFGSRVTFCAGNAVLSASKQAREQLLNLAGEILEENSKDLEIRDKKIFVKKDPDRDVTIAEVARWSYFQKDSPIITSGYYNGPYLPKHDPITYYGYPSPALVFATHIAEVEVDSETGAVSLKNFVAAHDLGRAINPETAEGQIEGGVMMGLGWALTEEVIFEKGEFKNPSFRDYKLLTALDIPEITPILVESVDPNGPFGAKGLGECAMVPTAPAVVNAIYNAIGVRIKNLPATPEKILAEIKKLRGDGT